MASKDSQIITLKQTIENTNKNIKLIDFKSVSTQTVIDMNNVGFID